MTGEPEALNSSVVFGAMVVVRNRSSKQQK